MNQHACGLGRDPITKSIAASDDWWENEINVLLSSYYFFEFFCSPNVVLMLYCHISFQRCVEAAKFRYAPLADEEKMSEIFDQHSVTNEYARVPTPTS